MTSAPIYPRTRTTAASTPTGPPATTAAPAGPPPSAPLAEDQRTLFVLTATEPDDVVDFEDLLPDLLDGVWQHSPVLRTEHGDALDLDKWADVRLIRLPEDLDAAGIGDHVTYARDWRETPEPVHVIERVMAIVRETNSGLTFDTV